MRLPLFYIESSDVSSPVISLNEETSKHVIKVLRMVAGDQINLTNGKGNLLTAEITGIHKKSCEVKISSSVFNPPSQKKITIAISLVKNASRFEWFLEKATELGVKDIIPLLCERTEKQHFRFERMNTILVSSMLQSQQSWLPHLHMPARFNDVVNESNEKEKFIAHCEDDINKKGLEHFRPFSDAIIIIGPEGDLTGPEIKAALNSNFVPVSLGNTRLRTETAGVVAASLLCLI